MEERLGEVTSKTSELESELSFCRSELVSISAIKERVVVAFETAKPIASNMGVDARLVGVSSGSGLSELVYSVKNTVRRIVGSCRGVVVHLTGGPCVLAVSLLLALLGLEDELAGRVKLRIEGEGFEHVYLEELAGLRPIPLIGDLRSVLKVVIRETLRGRLLASSTCLSPLRIRGSKSLPS